MPAPVVSPEQRLLTALAVSTTAAGQSIASALVSQLARQSSWNIVARHAIATGLAGLIAQAIDTFGLDVDRAARRQLVTASLYTEARNRRLLDELSMICQAARDLGQVVLPLKGCDLLCRGIYPLSTRTVTDIDVLVRPDAHEAVGQLLRERGYEAQPRAEHARRHEHHVLYRRAEQPEPLCVELHHTAVYTLFQRDTIDRTLLAEPRSASAILPHVPLMPAESTLLVLCTHLAHNRLRGQLKWPLDIVKLLPAVDLTSFWERARAAQAELAVRYVLQACGEVLALPQPVPPTGHRPTELARISLLRWLAPARRLFDDSRQPDYLARWIIDLALLDGLGQRARYSLLKLSELAERGLGWHLPPAVVRGKSSQT